MSRTLLALALLLPATAAAQLVPSDTLAPPPNTETLDLRAFRLIYDNEAPLFVRPIREANAISKPVFIGAVPVAAALTLATGADWDPVVRLGASAAVATGATYAFKGTIRRPRPYRTLEGVTLRAEEHNPDVDPFSFPSGHAAFAFALATSTTLSYPHWYVLVPAYAWASATAVARVWHGVHYPSDILAGAALGAGSAVLVHLFLPEIDGEEGAPVVVNLRVGL